MIAPLSLLLSSSLFFQTPAPLPVAPPAQEAGIAVEVLDKQGNPPRPGKAVDLTVTADGIARRVIAAKPIVEERPWRIVIWVDRVLSGSRTVRGATGVLAAQAPVLVGLGTVEVIVAEPGPTVILPPTRDAHAVDEALSRLLLTGDGRDDLRTLRQRFIDLAGAPTSASPPSPAGGGTDLAARAVESFDAETRLVGRQQDALIGWLAGERGDRRPSALFLVSDGFDRDPRELYLAKVTDPAVRAAVEKSLPAAALEASAAETARTVAELGWTVLPMPVGDERLPQIERFRLGGNTQMPTVTIRPGATKEEPPPPAPPLLLHPNEPLEAMAEVSGGEMLPGALNVAGALARLRARYWLRYEAAPSAAAHRLEIHAADAGFAVKARQWEGPATPEGVSAWRVRRLLSGEEEETDAGDLGLSAELRDGALDIQLDPEARPGADGLRLSLATENPESGAVAVTQRTVTAQDVGPDGMLRMPAPPAGTERLALLIDDPLRGVWGGQALDLAPEEESAEETAAVEKPLAAHPGERAASRGGNGVRIVKPASGRGTGPVDVEIEVKLPQQRRLERLELYWNDELQATLYGPPYAHRVIVPRDRSVGTLRAEARLDDGSVAEDALLLNSSAVGERVDVRLVEMLVVVTDKAGRPVRGLSRDAFRLLQDGKEQTIASFDDAGDFPLTVGLTLDSSASMFVKLPGVVDAARSLLTGGLTPRDSALLVGFATEPRLLVSPTKNLRSVSAGLGTLSADGGSNLFRAIEFSLQQIRSSGGRKALIVYSDGIGEGERGYGDCLRAARGSGIPIYLIVTNSIAAHARESGQALDRYAEKLEELAAATGAKAYFVSPSQDLKTVYAEILRELRSQYLLAYYPRANDLESWRKVDVELKEPGYRARTLSGYSTRR
jgi:Ca-activated chloride channel family protein